MGERGYVQKEALRKGRQDGQGEHTGQVVLLFQQEGRPNTDTV